VFKNDDDWWCWQGEEPVARIGFDWEQVFSQDTTQGNFNDPIDYYRVEFVPYIDI
jgi:hypothetical protein